MAAASSMFDRALLGPAVRDSFVKLNPAQLVRNPVMFTTAVVALLATVLLVLGVARGTAGLVGAVAATGLRLGSLYWQLHLPVYRLETPHDQPLFSARAVARVTGEHRVVSE